MSSKKIQPREQLQVIFWLYYYNHLLGVLPSDEIPSQIQKRKNQLEDWQVRRIEEFERPDIAGVELKQMSIRPTEGYIPWEARTTLLVSLPKFLPNVSLETDEGEIRIASITDPFVDPNFLFLHRQPFVVNGMPLAILSPAIGRADDAIIVEISIPRPFYPGIDLDHQRSVLDVWSDEYAQLHGHEFDPFLAKIGEMLLGIRGDGWPSREEIVTILKTADSYTVGYFDPQGTQTFHFFRPLVKLSTFVAARDLFLSRFIAARDHGHKSKKIQRLLFNETTFDAAGLQRFAKEIFSEFVASPSKYDEWWKTVWDEGSNFTKVRQEPNVARDIYYVVVPWFRVKGLKLDREVAAAGGEIDMLAAGASSGQIHRCGIEIKFAHHDRIIDGISIQLPAYMDALEAEAGLLIVLWCKGKRFPEPKRYDDIACLEGELLKNISRSKNIDVLTVDGSFRQPPSKRH